MERIYIKKDCKNFWECCWEDSSCEAGLRASPGLGQCDRREGLGKKLHYLMYWVENWVDWPGEVWDESATGIIRIVIFAQKPTFVWFISGSLKYPLNGLYQLCWWPSQKPMFVLRSLTLGGSAAEWTRNLESNRTAFKFQLCHLLAGWMRAKSLALLYNTRSVNTTYLAGFHKD